MSRNNPR